MLVLRALGLGDSLTGIAALRGLRRCFPTQRLVLAASMDVGSWLVGLGVVDGVLPLPGLVPIPPALGGHVAVNLHGSGPRSVELLRATDPARLIAFGCAAAGHVGPYWDPKEHEVLRWCRLVHEAGGTCGPEDLRLRPRPPGRPVACRQPRPAASAAHPGRTVEPAAQPERTVEPAAEPERTVGPVILHPGAAYGSKRWPALQWRAVAEEVSRSGWPVVVTGSAQEAALAGQVADDVPGARNLAGSLDLPGLTDLVGAASLLVSGDTGVAHLATALAVPSVVLFGPVSPSRWGPIIDVDLHTVLWRGDPDDLEPGDPFGDELDERLATITVTEVVAATLTRLEQSSQDP